MNRVCPGCSYVRKASDTAPDWQCPACEKAYSKAAGSEAGADYGRPLLPERQAPSGSGTVRRIVVLAAIGGALWWIKPFGLAGSGATEQPSTARGAQPEVTLYATEWCGYCAATRELFATGGIRYSEQDIEKSSSAAEDHRRLGGNGVPLIVIGDEIIHGYDEARLRRTLKPWLKRG